MGHMLDFDPWPMLAMPFKCTLDVLLLQGNYFLQHLYNIYRNCYYQSPLAVVFPSPVAPLRRRLLSQGHDSLLPPTIKSRFLGPVSKATIKHYAAQQPQICYNNEIMITT